MAGPKATTAVLGTGGLVRMMRGQTRFRALAEASSVYPGVQNLLLAARGLGLAANITIWHLMLEQEWKAALGIPHDVRTFAVIPIGWPKGNFAQVKRRPIEEVIHRDSW